MDILTIMFLSASVGRLSKFLRLLEFYVLLGEDVYDLVEVMRIYRRGAFVNGEVDVRE